MVVDILINFASLMIYSLFLAVTGYYVMGAEFADFFGNRIADAKKRKRGLDGKGSIKDQVNRMRYRVTGGFWKLIFTILSLPGKLISKGLLLLSEFIYNNTFQRIIKAKDSETASFKTKFACGIIDCIEYGINFGFLLLLGYITNQLFHTSLTGKGLFEGLFILFGIPYLQKAIIYGLLNDRLGDVKPIKKLKDGMNKFGERLFEMYGHDSVFKNLLFGAIQTVLATVSGFLGKFKFWNSFREKLPNGQYVWHWMLTYIPVMIIAAVILAATGNNIDAAGYLQSELGFMSDLKSFAETWIVLMITKILFFNLPANVVKHIKPELYVKITQKFERVSIKTRSFSTRIDNKFAPKGVHYSTDEELYDKADDENRDYYREYESTQQNQPEENYQTPKAAISAESQKFITKISKHPFTSYNEMRSALEKHYKVILRFPFATPDVKKGLWVIADDVDLRDKIMDVFHSLIPDLSTMNSSKEIAESAIIILDAVGNADYDSDDMMALVYGKYLCFCGDIITKFLDNNLNDDTIQKSARSFCN